MIVNGSAYTPTSTALSPVEPHLSPVGPPKPDFEALAAQS